MGTAACIPNCFLKLSDLITPARGFVAVRLALPEETRIVDGELVYLLLEETVAGSGFWAPLTALTEGLRGLWNVYVLQPTDDPDVFRIASRDVQVSYADSSRAYLSGALADGELIVGAGVHRLVPGQLVRRPDRVAAK